VAYLRVSTEKQGFSGLGIEAQRNIILTYVKEEEIVCWLEEHKSGKDLTVLPILEKAKKLVKENENYVLVISKADRFRNTEHALGIVNELGCDKIWFCNIGRNADKFMLTLFFAFAEKERLEISIRTKAALAVLKERGVKLGRPVVNKNLHEARKKGAFSRKKTAIKHNRNATIYAYFLRNITKISLSRTTERLNLIGYRTQTGAEWSNSSVYRILKRGYKI
jgi:DNA invertase Pin-like site-specific DNA recombinase